jgi:phosphate transport system substrate-binding protein
MCKKMKKDSRQLHFRPPLTVVPPAKRAGLVVRRKMREAAIYYRLRCPMAGILALVIGLTGLAIRPAMADIVRLRGSGTVAIVVREIAEQYMRADPGRTVVVSTGGSWWGFKSLIDGTADIAMASSDITEDLGVLAKENGLRLSATTIGKDAVVPIVAETNPLNGIALSRLRDVYRGRIKNWHEIGGADLPIEILSASASSGTFEVWRERVLGYGAVISPDAEIVAGSDLMGRLRASPGAIGYTTLAYVSSFHALAVDGAAATVDTVRAGQYAISRPLTLYVAEPVAPEIRRFLDFCMSPAGQAAVAHQRFVPMEVTR